MKKLVSMFLVLILSGFFSSLTLASEPLKGEVNASVQSNSPRWEEFCPQKYLNAQHIDAKLPSVYASFFMGLTIVLAPYGYYLCNKYEKAAENNYWVSRHQTFDDEIAACYKNKKTEQDCFAKVRENENAANLQKQLAEVQIQAAKAQIYVQAVNSALNQFQTTQMNNFNTVNTTPSVVNTNSYNYGSNNNSKIRLCESQCDNQRIMCRRGVQSAPTFGNDMSASRNAHLEQCELNYSRCVMRCSN